MPTVLAIGGSPSLYSKSAALLEYTRKYLENRGLSTGTIRVRDLPAEALLLAQADHPVIQQNIQQLAEASAVIIATPIYKAAYSGVLKTFLDVLPQTALADKIILPLATGGSPAHTLAIDYALKPVLAALGARQFLNGVYFTDTQIQTNGNFQDFQLQVEAEERLLSSLQELVERLPLGVK